MWLLLRYVLLFGLLELMRFFLIFIICVIWSIYWSSDVFVTIKDDSVIVFNYLSFMFDVTGIALQKIYRLKICRRWLPVLLFVFGLL